MRSAGRLIQDSRDRSFAGPELRHFDIAHLGGAKKITEFPPPVGNAAVYYTGHAESVAIPRNLPGLNEVTLHGGVKPGYIVKLIKAMSTLGLFKTHKRRARLAKIFHKIESWF